MSTAGYPIKDIGSELDGDFSLTEDDLSGTTDGSGIDTIKSDNHYHSAKVYIHVFNGDAGDDLTFKVEESSDDGNSDAYSVLTDDKGNEFTANVTDGTGTTATIDVSGVGFKQWLRVAVTSASFGSTNADVVALIVLGGGSRAS